MIGLTKKSWILVAAILILSCLLAHQYAAHQYASKVRPVDSPASTRAYEIDGLEAAAESLDLGEVWEDKAFAWDLPIRNRTSAAIAIEDFLSSCGCIEIAPRSLTIAASHTEIVRLNFDLTRRFQEEIGQSQRSVAFEITPRKKAQAFSHGKSWKLHGIVKSRVTLDALSLDFGEMAVRGQPPPRLKIRATSHVPVDRLEATVDPRVATVQVQRRADNADTFEVVISPQPALPCGSFKSQVRLDVLTSIGERLPGTTLPIQGQMQPEIRLLPARLFLGSKPVGETAEATVVLQAPAGVGIRVEHIETDSPDVRVEPIAVDGSHAGSTFQVTQRVAESGDQKSVVRFFIRKSGQKLDKVAMEICYRGESRGNSVSASEKDAP